ncbi:hypothetical protein JW879_00425 [candidate division WOR-3 bacterium]|nr:hypothetical protein [candidate division WOR-3 bacterium]
MELDSVTEEKVITSSKDMNGWIKFLAIFSIAIGALYALSIFGIIIAWMPIWLGIILLKASKNCREVADGKVESLGDTFNSLKTFFILTGIFTIISTALSVIWFIIFGIAMVGGILGETGGFY